MKQINIGEAIRFGWESFKKHAGFLIGLSLLLGVLYIAMDFAGKAFKDEGSMVFNILLQILFFIFGMLLSIGTTKIYLKLQDGQEAPFTELINHSELLWKYFVGQILYGLIVLGGLILLVIPGIYWAIKYMYTETLIIDKGMDPFLALKKSGEMTKDIKLRLIVFMLAQLGIAILGVIALGVGLLVAIPVIMFAHLYVYRYLLHTTEAAPVQTAPVETPAPQV